MCTAGRQHRAEAPPLTLWACGTSSSTGPGSRRGEHWPDHPGLIGGRDLKAGGTWLAVDPGGRRAAALLNGRGRARPETTRSPAATCRCSPLPRAACPTSTVPLRPLPPGRRRLARVRLWSWDGERLATTEVARRHQHDRQHRPGAGTSGSPPSARFEAAPDWNDLITGEPSDAPEALIVRHEPPGGRVFASLSATLVTLAPEGVTYQFTDLTAGRGRIGSQT